MTQSTTEFDSPWKQIIEQFFEAFMSFFFPQIHESIDWTQGYEFLDKELQKVVREAITQERRVDKLVKVWRKDGEPALLYIHIEVQAQFDSQFPERIFIYHYRLYDRYGQRVISLAVLGDNDPDWQPNNYSYDNFGCGLSFHFPIVKLLDYEDKWDELEDSNNPFSIVVRTHLKALDTSRSPQRRYLWKTTLYKALYEANYSKQEILELYHFLDWVLALPQAYAHDFDEFVTQYEEAKKVQYVTHIERKGIEKGLEKGLQQGRQEGALQKSQEAVTEILAVRFKQVPESLIKTIQTIDDSSLLSQLLREAVLVESIETFEKQLKKRTFH